MRIAQYFTPLNTRKSSFFSYFRAYHSSHKNYLKDKNYRSSSDRYNSKSNEAYKNNRADINNSFIKRNYNPRSSSVSNRPSIDTKKSYENNINNITSPHKIFKSVKNNKDLKNYSNYNYNKREEIKKKESYNKKDDCVVNFNKKDNFISNKALNDDTYYNHKSNSLISKSSAEELELDTYDKKDASVNNISKYNTYRNNYENIESNLSYSLQKPISKALFYNNLSKNFHFNHNKSNKVNLGWCYESLDVTGKTVIENLYDTELDRIHTILATPLPDLLPSSDANFASNDNKVLAMPPDFAIGIQNYNHKIRSEYRAVIARYLGLDEYNGEDLDDDDKNNNKVQRKPCVYISTAWSSRYDTRRFAKGTQKVLGVTIIFPKKETINEVCDKEDISKDTKKDKDAQYNKTNFDNNHNFYNVSNINKDEDESATIIKNGKDDRQERQQKIENDDENTINFADHRERLPLDLRRRIKQLLDVINLLLSSEFVSLGIISATDSMPEISSHNSLSSTVKILKKKGISVENFVSIKALIREITELFTAVFFVTDEFQQFLPFRNLFYSLGRVIPLVINIKKPETLYDQLTCYLDKCGNKDDENSNLEMLHRESSDYTEKHANYNNLDEKNEKVFSHKNISFSMPKKEVTFDLIKIALTDIIGKHDFTGSRCLFPAVFIHGAYIGNEIELIYLNNNRVAFNALLEKPNDIIIKSTFLRRAASMNQQNIVKELYGMQHTSFRK